ncbi:unnamed protein product [Mucor hiemalis]
MANTLPLDLQQVICRYAIGFKGSTSFAIVALQVNKAWAYFVCKVLYRHYRIRNYLTFIGFVKTVTSPSPILPYGLFVRSIDLTPVNKYGIDMRAHRLIRCCPNIREMTLGHPTTLKTETIREIAKYNKRLHTLSMGGIESFPFMLECDFAGLQQLQHVTLKTTPLLATSFMTLPKILKSIRLIQMDAITPSELLLFCQGHSKLQSLAIVNCRVMTDNLGEALAKLITPHEPLACLELQEIELVGQQITDDNLNALFSRVPKGTRLKSLRLYNTSVTKSLFVFAGHQCNLKINHLDLINNRYLL